MGQQRCIATYYNHDEGVWALQTDEAFTQVFSSGRDSNVYWQDLRRDENRALVFQESAPVLKMILTPDQGGLWVSTAESNVKYWDVGKLDLSRRPTTAATAPSAAAASSTSSGEQNKSAPPHAAPLLTVPDMVIAGGSSIKSFEVLNDKRHIVTKDTDSNVAVYDVLKAHKVEDLGKVDFEEEVKKRDEVRVKILC